MAPSNTDIEIAKVDLDILNSSPTTEHGTITVDLKDADEALAFLSNHPRAAEVALEGQAILDDPVQNKKLLRKIDLTVPPLLAAVYFLQYLDKTTLSYAAVMGIRKDTHLEGQVCMLLLDTPLFDMYFLTPVM
jgi:ACS family allantoate permease-like MFS transporter